MEAHLRLAEVFGFRIWGVARRVLMFGCLGPEVLVLSRRSRCERVLLESSTVRGRFCESSWPALTRSPPLRSRVLGFCFSRRRLLKAKLYKGTRENMYASLHPQRKQNLA